MSGVYVLTWRDFYRLFALLGRLHQQRPSSERYIGKRYLRRVVSGY